MNYLKNPVCKHKYGKYNLWIDQKGMVINIKATQTIDIKLKKRMTFILNPLYIKFFELWQNSIWQTEYQFLY